MVAPQRAWRAACPNCGAPVEFASAASASAVCSFCRSTLVRDGEALRRIGQSAELFDDHSPLQLGVAGRWQDTPFTLVGRRQLRYPEGSWNEWHALFDSGRSGWLSEDNGAYVVAFDVPLEGSAPSAASLVAGTRVTVQGAAWSVASVVAATLHAAEGELPAPPLLDGAAFTVADLRNDRDEVATLDYGSPGAPTLSLGRPVRLAELALTGLRQLDGKSLGGKSFDCPSCGAPLELTLKTTQSIVCGQCKAVVNLSTGVGADLQYYGQSNAGHDGAEPLIPLGRNGTLAINGPGLPWQVVGYVERCDLPDPGDDEEQTFWREYLLYNQQEGFAFLVDAEDGWSAVRPLTGAPQVSGDVAQWKGRAFRKRYAYQAKVAWVLGEFYWQLKRDEQALVTDYFGLKNASGRRLSREQTGAEVTWSEGGNLDAAAVVKAFNLDPRLLPSMQRDVAPMGDGTGFNFGKWKTVFWIGLIIAMVAISLMSSDDGLMSSNDGRDCDSFKTTFGEASNEYQQCLAQARAGGGSRTRGGSYGGFSSGGGGHK
ncbi:MAG: DUF4178 domain-containing protein [Aquabacterium sp.]